MINLTNGTQSSENFFQRKSLLDQLAWNADGTGFRVVWEPPFCDVLYIEISNIYK